MDCQWISFENRYKCSQCGFIVKNSSIKKNCTKDKPPNIVQRARNLSGAVVEHIRTGMEHCTEEERQIRFEICKKNTCRLFLGDDNGGICGHQSCGCYLRNRGRFMDKLSWAESKCPVGLWGQAQPKEENI